MATTHGAQRWEQAFPPVEREGRGWLMCGIAAPLVYLASDVLTGVLWSGYSFRDQTISELAAIGSPTRGLAVALGLVGYVLMTAFGVGVWRTAGAAKPLHTAGALIVAFGLFSLPAVPFAPMHVRAAQETLTDTLHLVLGGVAVCLIIVTMAYGAAAHGNAFRLYTIATVVVLLAFGAWTAVDGARIAADLPTPWAGVKERISVYAYQAWFVVFAMSLLRRNPAGR